MPEENDHKTDTKFFRSVTEAMKEAGKVEGRSLAQTKLWITTSVVGILWVITMALAGIIWKDSTGKIEKLEIQTQQLVVDNATMKAEKVDLSRRMEAMEKDIKEVLAELRKPK